MVNCIINVFTIILMILSIYFSKITTTVLLIYEIGNFGDQNYLPPLSLAGGQKLH